MGAVLWAPFVRLGQSSCIPLSQHEKRATRRAFVGQCHCWNGRSQHVSSTNEFSGFPGWNVEVGTTLSLPPLPSEQIARCREVPFADDAAAAAAIRFHSFWRTAASNGRRLAYDTITIWQAGWSVAGLLRPQYSINDSLYYYF